MVILISVAALLISLLSPAIGYLFIISVCGGYLYRNVKYAYYITGILFLGVIILGYVRLITPLEIGDITVGVGIIMLLFMRTLYQKKNYTIAFFYAGLLQVIYGIIRWLTLGSIYEEKVETFFLGYKTFIEENIAGLGETIDAQTNLLETFKGIMLDYQVAIWGITMLVSMYIAMVFLAKRLDITWKHRLIRFPYLFSYVLIATLLLSIIPETRIIGINGLLMIMVFFLIQGLSIIDFFASAHLKSSRFVMLATIVLMFINIFFAIIIATLGLLDYWLDIRKLNEKGVR